MADRLNVMVLLAAENAEDGAEFTKTTHEVFNLPYDGFVRVQGLLLGVLAEMHRWGEARAGEKAAEKAGGQA